MSDGFKRLNFFKGFLTQAKDWKEGHDYHIEKRRVQTEFLHWPGIVPGCLNQLLVTAGDNGTSLNIEPGYAIDGNGRDLLLTESVNLPLVDRDLKPPCTIYVSIRYAEELVDRRDNLANPEFSDFAFIREDPKVSIGVAEPDNSELIELARINLKEELVIKDPQNTEKPGPNEIDTRFVRQAGAKFIFSRSHLMGMGRSVYLSELYKVLHREASVVFVAKSLEPGTHTLVDELTVVPNERARLLRNSRGEIMALALEPDELPHLQIGPNDIVIENHLG